MPQSGQSNKTHKLPITRSPGDVWQEDVRRALRDVWEKLKELEARIVALEP